MRTLQYLSIAFMLIAGSAGAIDFLKMYRTGDINRIYKKDSPDVVSSVSFETAEKKLEEIPVNPEIYSREPLDPELNAKVRPHKLPNNEAAKQDVADTMLVMPAEIKSDDILASTTSTQPVKQDGKSKPKLNLRMYSRAALVEVETIENLEPPVDSTAAYAILDSIKVQKQ